MVPLPKSLHWARQWKQEIVQCLDFLKVMCYSRGEMESEAKPSDSVDTAVF